MGGERSLRSSMATQKALQQLGLHKILPKMGKGKKKKGKEKGRTPGEQNAFSH